MNVQTDIDASLRKLRWRRVRALAAVPLAFLVFLIPAVVRFKSGRANVVFGGAVAAVTFLGMCGCWLHAVFSRCPRCSHLFYIRGVFGNVFARRCSHCGLALKAQKDNGDGHIKARLGA